MSGQHPTGFDAIHAETDGAELTHGAVAKMAALAIVQARLVAMELRETVLPALAPGRRTMTSRLLRRLEQEDLFAWLFSTSSKFSATTFTAVSWKVPRWRGSPPTATCGAVARSHAVIPGPWRGRAPATRSSSCMSSFSGPVPPPARSGTSTSFSWNETTATPMPAPHLEGPLRPNPRSDHLGSACRPTLLLAARRHALTMLVAQWRTRSEAPPNRLCGLVHDAEVVISIGFERFDLLLESQDERNIARAIRTLLDDPDKDDSSRLQVLDLVPHSVLHQALMEGNSDRPRRRGNRMTSADPTGPGRRVADGTRVGQISAARI